jgi:hypothetical protein
VEYHLRIALAKLIQPTLALLALKYKVICDRHLDIAILLLQQFGRSLQRFQLGLDPNELK